MAEKTNSKNRLVAAILLTALLGVGGGAYYFSTSNAANKQEVDEKSISMSVTKSNVDAVPGQSEDPEYNAAQQKVNEQNLQKAKENDESFVPRLVNDTVKEEEFKIPEIKAPEPEPEPEPEPIKEPEPIVEPEPPVQPQPAPVIQQPVEQPKPVIQQNRYEIIMPQEQPKETVDVDLEALYIEEIRGLQKKWEEEYQSPEKVRALAEKNYFGAEIEMREETNGMSAQSTDSDGNGKSNQKAGATFVRATTIVPAEMLTAVNTDEPGPVMARIVSGPLKGARVLGEVVNAPTDVTSNVQKATIQFTQIQLPNENGVYDINVFAIDPKTSRTAVASSVDNHYFRRYGLGLAAAFIEGLGEAYQNVGKETTILDQAVVTTMSKETKTIQRSALGKVGQKLGGELSKISDVPATIYVDAGTPIGLLFMSDF